MGGAFALDFGAIFTMAEALSVDSEMLATVLPSVERIIISRVNNSEGSE
jgi:hypothetical protein